jgi:hypothetical protein
MNYEDTVATAVIEVLETCGDADIEAGIGSVFQEPLSTVAIALRDKIGAAAIRAVAEWNYKYAQRSEKGLS